MSSLPPTPSAEPGAAAPAATTQPAATGASYGSSRHGERSRREHGAERGYSPFLPLALLVIAGVTWSGFQCYQLTGERQALATVHANQNRQFEDSGKLRNSLDAIAKDTAVLANRGNPSAKLIVDELAKRGVTINPAGAAGTTQKADK